MVAGVSVGTVRCDGSHASALARRKRDTMTLVIPPPEPWTCVEGKSHGCTDPGTRARRDTGCLQARGDDDLEIVR